MEPKLYDAAAMLRDAATRHGVRLPVLVAETALWASPKAHTVLLEHTGAIALFPNRRRYRGGQGERPGQRVDSVVLDNNSYANAAIKRAVGVHRANLRGFEACHVW